VVRPAGWDPDLGFDTAIDLLGWTCQRVSGGSAADAVERLRAADGPVFVGPVEFGLLLHHPGSGTVLDSDHFMVVTAVADGVVHFHDPHGFPFATLPVDEFMTGPWTITSASPTGGRCHWSLLPCEVLAQHARGGDVHLQSPSAPQLLSV
jgi:hypothetical protein